MRVPYPPAAMMAPWLLLFGACATDDSGLQRIEGTVHLVDIEGGCWVIETAAGRVLPLGLPEKFQREGLAITAKARDVKDVFTTCQTGTLKQIEEIEERK